LPFLFSSIRYDDAGGSAHRTYLQPVPAAVTDPERPVPVRTSPAAHLVVLPQRDRFGFSEFMLDLRSN
jgi:hypothetical protein